MSSGMFVHIIKVFIL